MRKLLLLLVFFPILLSAQNELDLMPTNMQNYLGKVNRKQFEKIVGEPVDMEMNSYVYNVMNTYTKEETGIRCYYRESDGILISVKFSTKSFLGYCIDFGGIGTKEYPGVKGYVDDKTNAKYYYLNDRRRGFYRVDYQVKNFGMDIDNIDRSIGTCTVNYHI